MGVMEVVVVALTLVVVAVVVLRLTATGRMMAQLVVAPVPPGQRLLLRLSSAPPTALVPALEAGSRPHTQQLLCL